MIIDEVVTIAGRHYRLRSVTPEDAEAVAGLFRHVFGETPPPGWFDWKYSAVGLDGRALGLWSDTEKLVAHVGGFPRQIFWRGKSVTGLQIGDVMVAPQERGWLTRHGPFFHVCDRFYRHWIGADKPFKVSFGFPNARHMRLGIHLGLYSDLGAVERWVWSARRRRMPLWWRTEEIHPSETKFALHIASAWQAMQRGMPSKVFGSRNITHVHQRFLLRPGVTHRFFRVAMRGFGPQGVAVLRTEGQCWRWLDFIGPTKLLPIAARAVQAFAASGGASWIEIWALASARGAFERLGADFGGEVARFALVHPSSCPDDGLAKDGWYWSGDTDFL